MNNFWQEDIVSEREMAEQQEESTYTPMVKYEDIDQKIVEDIEEKSSYDLEKKDVTVIHNARVRLAQARLYEMLIDHDIFADIQEDPQAIKNVRKELKEYIVERLEILLGLRQERVIQSQVSEIELPFNGLEIEFLKELSFKGTKGESGNIEKTTTVEVKTQESPKLLVARPAANQLKSLAGPKTPQTVAIKETVAPTKTVKAEVKKPVGRPAKSTKGNEFYGEVNEKNAVQLAKEEIAQIAGKPFDQITPTELVKIKKQMVKKSFDQMNAEEQETEMKRVAEKYKKPSTSGAIPIPSIEEQTMTLLSRQSQAGGDLQLFNKMLAGKMASSPIETVE
jgi:hypothetical protein